MLDFALLPIVTNLIAQLGGASSSELDSGIREWSSRRRARRARRGSARRGMRRSGRRSQRLQGLHHSGEGGLWDARSVAAVTTVLVIDLRIAKRSSRSPR